MPHPQLTYVYQGKLGLSTARNRGAAIAQGSILAYLDDDAEAAPHWLAALAAAVEAHPQAAIAGGPVSLIWPPACTPPRWLSPGLAENLGAYDLGATLERITNPGQTPRGLNYAVKQSFLAAVGGFDPHLGRVGKNLLSNEELHRHEWVLIVDCDERITPELWDEIEAVIQQDACDGYYLNRRVFFLGTWIRHGGKYPDWNLRLFRHAKGRYENLQTSKIPNTGDNEMHEHVMIEGRVGYLKHDILHEDFRDLYHWLARHNRYSNWEAQVYYNPLTGMGNGGTIGASLLGDAVQRKRFLKKIWVRLPAKPLLRFVLFYVVQLGFLDGRAGYIYGRLLSQYEYQIGVKLFELRQFGGQLNVAAPAEPSPVPPPRSTSSMVSSRGN